MNASGGPPAHATTAVATSAATLPTATLNCAVANRCMADKHTNPTNAGSIPADRTTVSTVLRTSVEEATFPPTHSAKGKLIAQTIQQLQ